MLTPASIMNDNRCPVCGSYDIEGQDITIETKRAYQKVSCCDCDSTWYDSYDFVGCMDYECDERFKSISPDLYTVETFPNGIRFSHLTPDDAPNKTYHHALYEQMKSVIDDLAGYTDGPVFSAALREAVKIRTGNDVNPGAIPVRCAWGEVTANLIQDGFELQLSFVNAITGIPLATIFLIDKDSAYINPWIALYDRIKNASVPYIQDIMKEASASLERA